MQRLLAVFFAWQQPGFSFLLPVVETKASTSKASVTKTSATEKATAQKTEVADVHADVAWEKSKPKAKRRDQRRYKIER